MAPRKVPLFLAVVDPMTVGALFAKSAIALEQGLLVPVGKRARKTQVQEHQLQFAATGPKNPPALQLVLPHIPFSIYQSV